MSSFIVALSFKESKILSKIGKATDSNTHGLLGILATCQVEFPVTKTNKTHLSYFVAWDL